MSVPTKEVEVSYEEQEAEVPASMDYLYRVTISLRPGQVTTTTITTPCRAPLPTFTLLCDNLRALTQLVEATGSTLRFKSCLPARSPQTSATLLVRVTEGIAARRVPL